MYTPSEVGGGDRTHPENARKSGGHEAQELAPSVGQQILLDAHGAVLAVVVLQYYTDLSTPSKVGPNPLYPGTKNLNPEPSTLNHQP